MSRTSSVLRVFGLVSFLAVGCVPASSGAGGAGGSGGSTSAASSPSTDPTCVPSAVRSVLTSCTSCHGSKPQSGLPALVTVADFEATSPFGGTYGERSVLRMKNASSPMPPGSLLSSTEVAAFQSWVDGGYAMECPSASTTSSSTSGAGASTTSSTGTGVVGN